MCLQGLYFRQIKVFFNRHKLGTHMKGFEPLTLTLTYCSFTDVLDSPVPSFAHIPASQTDRSAKHDYFLNVSPPHSVFSVQDVCGVELRDDHFLDHDCPLEGKLRSLDISFQNNTLFRSYLQVAKSINVILTMMGFQLCCMNHVDLQNMLFFHLSNFLVLLFFTVILPPERAAECQSYKVSPENGDPLRKNAKNDVR